MTASVCKKSGKLARSGLCDCDPRGSMVITEIFAEGTVPKEYCDTHVRANICTMSGAIAGENCPFVQQSGQVFIVRPDSSYVIRADGSKYMGSTADSPYEISAAMIAAGCPLHGGTGSVNSGTVITAPNQVEWPQTNQTQVPQDQTQQTQTQTQTAEPTTPPAEDVPASEDMGTDSGVIDQSTGLPVVGQ